MSTPLVSILIPCFNCATWVARAVQSALDQTWEPKEVIVIDDGSTDNSWQVIRSFGSAIRAQQQVNQGPAKTRNRLLALSRGNWLQYLDADDELTPDKIERQIEYCHLGDVLYGSMQMIWFDGIAPIRQTEKRAVSQIDAWAGWFRWLYPNPGAFLFRRDLLKQIGGWDESYKLLCEDYALLSRLLFVKACLVATPDAWSIYRQWSNTQSVNKYEAEIAEVRLGLMLQVAQRLEEQDELNVERKRAFLESAFPIVRNLYAFNPETGVRAWARLRDAACPLVPPSACTPAAYRCLYRLFGFVVAERMAAFRRNLLHTSGSRL
jgi:GT2 family glycosyltransferase